MFQVRIVRLQHRASADAPVEDLWRLLGATNIPYEKRALWEANDLRIGDGAQLAADRMSELATETADRSTQVTIVQIRENSDFVIPIGGERDAIDFLWSDASGRLQGRRFEKCMAEFRLVCSNDPRDPTAVRIALVPEILYGPEEPHWVRTSGGAITQRIERSTFTLTDFAADVRLPAARLLVLGGQATPGLSLGEAFFCGEPRPGCLEQTLIITVERVKVEPLPEGGSVPLVSPTLPQDTAKARPGPALRADPAANAKPRS